MIALNKYIDEIKKDASKIDKFQCIIDKIFHELKEKDHDEYCKYMLEIHKIVYGCHFNEEIACKAVAAMENVDGTVGEHWNISTTTNYANQYGLDKHDFYYVMNMLYSDFREVLQSESADLYAKMAKAYITDKDAKEGKAFKLYMAGHN